MSVYNDEPLTQLIWTEQSLRIKTAFQRLNPAWYNILKERLREKQFTNRRFIDAVNELIDTCEYPEPSPARILNFDRKIKLLTEPEFLKKSDEFGSTLRNYYQQVDVDGKMYYATNEDVEKYRLKKWIPRPAEPKPEVKEEYADISSDLREAINKIGK